ncbi:hypothetical protein HGI30_06695 [Paenibacillus albicereus]|uniref:Uncharacterized protein n=1 Tax=Paenibacillus albicereus TaxID=2726185 RepID=A0A6H2GV06_9BACL|nr:hypothetical protein [Paenibacillus albicereus]QJC51263.1 hypothetical protein HGI30_06695 [Paenibacillus albicereus]
MTVSAVLLLMALLIDYSRIAAFQYKLDSLAGSSVRSVLAAYDEPLYERYGLFGRGGTDAAQLAAEALDASRGRDGLSDRTANADDASMRRVDLLQLRLGEPSAQPALMLGEWPVLRRQIEQEMKIKGPIDMTLELFDKLRPLEGSMQQAKQEIDMLQQSEKIFDKRQRALTEMLELGEAAAAVASETGSDGLVPLPGLGQADTFKAAADGYGPYLAWLAADEAAQAAYQAALLAAPTGAEGLPGSPIPSPPMLNTASIQDYEAAAGEAASRLLELAPAADQHDRLIGQALQQLELALQAEKELERLAASAPAAAAPPAGSAAPAGGAADLSGLLLGRSWFDQTKSELQRQGSRLRAFAAEASVAGRRLEQALTQRSLEFVPLLLADAALLADKLKPYWQAYVSPGQELQERKEMLKASDNSKGLREAEKKKADSLWKQAKEMLDGFERLKAAQAELEEFGKVEQLSAANRAFNESLGQRADSGGGQAETDGPADVVDTADEAIADAQNTGSGVLAGLESLLAAGGERLLMAEYGARRFSSMDPRRLQTLLVGGSSQEAPTELASLSQQELEYILYGYANPGANLAAAYGELFALRLAIRTMEGLIASRAAGHPLLVLAMAGVYGLQHALGDMRELGATGTSELSKYAPVRLGYLDYMRLFMLAHGTGDKPLSRMAGIIEHRTGARLDQVPTGMSVALSGSIPLWFLPGLARLAGHAGLLDGQVTGGRYEATSIAGWSYG